MTRRVLVAGVGNIFLGDDAFGVYVARALVERALPGVVVRDFGTRGVDLAYTLADGVDALVLVDCMQHGKAPGTLTVIEPDFRSREPVTELAGPAHGVDPCRVFSLLHALGGSLHAAFLVACEPLAFGSDEEPMLELSAPVRAAVTQAVPLVEAMALQLGSASEVELAEAFHA